MQVSPFPDQPNIWFVQMFFQVRRFDAQKMLVEYVSSYHPCPFVVLKEVKKSCWSDEAEDQIGRKRSKIERENKIEKERRDEVEQKIKFERTRTLRGVKLEGFSYLTQKDVPSKELDFEPFEASKGDEWTGHQVQQLVCVG